MTDWRKSAIHQHALQKALDTNFALQVSGSQGGKRRDHCAARRSKTDTLMTDDGDDEVQDRNKDKSSKRRRVTLQKSRRVVTEIDSHE